MNTTTATTTFGAPQPLPGQRGYKQTISSKLSAETVEMEQRLGMLKTQMEQEKRKRENVVKKGGCRWNNARTDRGSVRDYARDVLKREDRKGTRKGKKRPSQQRKQSKNQEPEHRAIASTKAPAQWTVEEVSNWMQSINLGAFADTFRENDIDGNILLDLAPDDLDYMSITKLAQRKILFRGIESLKRGGSGQVKACAIVDELMHEPDEATNHKQQSTEAKVVHWSQMEPISKNTVTNPEGPEAVNLADGQFDEDASHASFMEALLSWRNADATADTKTADTGMWTNPMATIPDEEVPETTGGKLLDGDFDEEKEHEAFRRAVDAWRNAGNPTPPSKPSCDISASTGGGLKKSCWTCYRVFFDDDGVVDGESKKAFCSPSCLQQTQQQYDRFKQSKE